MVLGQNPGDNEDKQGEPFVGVSGKKLNKGLAFIGLKRENVWISNIVKCHTLNNRKPYGNEVERCAPWLAKELKIIQPKLILMLGNTPLEALTGYSGISNWRGKLFYFKQHNFWGFVIYHPSAIRNNERRKHWNYDWDSMKILFRDGFTLEKWQAESNLITKIDSRFYD